MSDQLEAAGTAGILGGVVLSCVAAARWLMGSVMGRYEREIVDLKARIDAMNTALSYRDATIATLNSKIGKLRVDAEHQANLVCDNPTCPHRVSS